MDVLPWSEMDSLQLETGHIKDQLVALNRRGFLTINSQPRVNGVSSSDPNVGWGGPNGCASHFHVRRQHVLQLSAACPTCPASAALCVCSTAVNRVSVLSFLGAERLSASLHVLHVWLLCCLATTVLLSPLTARAEPQRSSTGTLPLIAKCGCLCM